MPLTKIEHYLVLTDDLEATRDFYVQALGMHQGERPPLGACLT
jgi:catechol 2,3-dioxygenase-like lactoylglutathione lyase family enzyme